MARQPINQNTWEPIEKLVTCEQELRDFEDNWRAKAETPMEKPTTLLKSVAKRIAEAISKGSGVDAT